MEGMAGEATMVEQVVLSLEQATHMAKQLHTTTDPTHVLQIYTSLHQAHHHLSAFLSKTQLSLPPPLLFPPSPAAAAAAAANSLSSATGAATATVADGNDTQPMQIIDGDDDDAVEEAGENSKGTLDMVEDKMRDFFIRNKRPKRSLSPSAVAEDRRLYDDGSAVGVKGFDPHSTRLRALDLVYQFHG
ncbi:hypothetical protein I3842_01G050600 [Carya illinoinensis]|uniref:Uncharacterized protein n=1 Tax=Carya illinoinensis TaxID=32201 RepID=A0A922K5Q9_CARIL|nr:hypothetical protein I3842_01G050600 [Carya illinoinensis]